jgi:hypothetical protein
MLDSRQEVKQDVRLHASFMHSAVADAGRGKGHRDVSLGGATIRWRVLRGASTGVAFGKQTCDPELATGARDRRVVLASALRSQLGDVLLHLSLGRSSCGLPSELFLACVT